MYGTQATTNQLTLVKRFENDVKMYGTQAMHLLVVVQMMFENDVKMYGTQAKGVTNMKAHGLRMM